MREKARRMIALISWTGQGYPAFRENQSFWSIFEDFNTIFWFMKEKLTGFSRKTIFKIFIDFFQFAQKFQSWTGLSAAWCTDIGVGLKMSKFFEFSSSLFLCVRGNCRKNQTISFLGYENKNQMSSACQL